MSIYPLFLSQICTQPANLIYCALVGCNLALLVFGAMHLLNRLSSRSVQLLAADELKKKENDHNSPSTLDKTGHDSWSYHSNSNSLSLTFYRERTKSTISQS